MIPPQGLRIGNIILIGSKNVLGTIKSIDEGTCTVLDHSHYSETEFGYSLNEINSIPVSEEILLKFGFEETYKSDYRHKFDLDINTEFGFDFDLNGNTNGMQGFRHYGRYYKCEYLHQLQNLYYFMSGGQELNTSGL